MGKNYFTPEQVELLRKNKYVKHVSEKSITYTEELKKIFINEYKCGNTPSAILIQMGFDVNILGRSRIHALTERFKKQSKRPEGLKDTRIDSSGRPRTRDLTQEELIKRQQDQIEYLKQQVEFLSDLRRLEREAMWKASKSKKRKDSK